MRNSTQDDRSRQRAEPNSPRGLTATLAAVWGYRKLVLGALLVALLVLFVVQNGDAIHVKFLVWEADMSQALLVLLAVLSGVVFAVVFNRWQRWRSSRVQR